MTDRLTARQKQRDGDTHRPIDRVEAKDRDRKTESETETESESGTEAETEVEAECQKENGIDRIPVILRCFDPLVIWSCGPSRLRVIDIQSDLKVI